MKGNGVCYIEKISNLYSLPDSTKAELLTIVDKIDQELDLWSWEDIDYAIDFFYTKKNDKSYPKVSQVRAILNTNRHDKRSNLNAQSDFDKNGIVMPSTKIRAIQDVFLNVNRMAHLNGLFYSEYFAFKENLPFGNKSYVKDKVLHNKRFEWDRAVEEAKHRFPDTFGMFKNLNVMEEFAFAYKLGVLK